MEGAGKFFLLDKIVITFIDLLQQRGLDWMKKNVLSEGKPFVNSWLIFFGN